MDDCEKEVERLRAELETARAANTGLAAQLTQLHSEISFLRNMAQAQHNTLSNGLLAACTGEIPREVHVRETYRSTLRLGPETPQKPKVERELETIRPANEEMKEAAHNPKDLRRPTEADIDKLIPGKKAEETCEGACPSEASKEPAMAGV